MKPTKYSELALQVAIEIDALVHVQLRSIPFDSDYPEMWALRSFAIRTIALASIVKVALTADDAPEEGLEQLQFRLYGLYGLCGGNDATPVSANAGVTV